MFERLDHLGIAVEELDAAVTRYREAFDMELVHREVLAEHGIEAALLEVGDEHVELVASLSEDSSVGRFLADRGPGIHHVAYRVADIDAALADLRARGVEMIDAAPRPGLRDSRIAFVHPRSTGGVLTEIVEAASRMNATKHVKASIGFAGGQVLAVRVTAEALERLNAALGTPAPWFDLELDDGAVRISISPRSPTCASIPTSRASASGPDRAGGRAVCRPGVVARRADGGAYA